MEKTIDFVFPYVDCEDTVWQQNYIAARKKDNLPTEISLTRFRKWDNLKFLFRGIEKFMPFVRNVYMIVSNEEQIPSWVNRETVKIVYHKDIIPSSLLPTFNSCTIEMYLGNIKGLSDYFIYGNDDVFPIGNLTEKDFFECCKLKINMTKETGDETMFKKVMKATQKLATCCLKKHYPDFSWFYAVQHSMNPMKNKTVKECQCCLGKQMKDSCTRFRNEKNYNQYLYSYFDYFRDEVIPSTIPFKYFSIEPRKINRIVDYIVNGKANIICLNDSKILSTEQFESCRDSIIEAFEKIFPDVSMYEIDASNKSISIEKSGNKLIVTLGFTSTEQESFLINEIKNIYNKSLSKTEISKNITYSDSVAETDDANISEETTYNSITYYTKEKVDSLLSKFKVCECPEENATDEDLEALFDGSSN